MGTFIEAMPLTVGKIRAALAPWPAIVAYVAEIAADPRCTDSPIVTVPTVEIHGSLVTLSWCNIVALFTTATSEAGGALLISEEIDWTSIDPSGRRMACY